ncbi:hypothetical protein M2169_001980 [Streptomyces sp. MJP52]|nr:hypothetical protein [Streptomyces sp. MJP52]
MRGKFQPPTRAVVHAGVRSARWTTVTVFGRIRRHAFTTPPFRHQPGTGGEFPDAPRAAAGHPRGALAAPSRQPPSPVQTGRMRTDLVSEPSELGFPNEDFVSVGLPASGLGGALVMLDGVTPPRGGTGCVHSVPWFTARLGGALTELSLSRRDLPLTEVLAGAIGRTAAAHADGCDLSHPRTPQATVVVARWDAETVEHLALADSVLLIERDGGEVTAHTDDRLARIPRERLRSAAVVDATLRNKEGGFWTAAADPRVAGRAVTGVVPRRGVRSLTALTDGAARWVEVFGRGGWADVVTLVRERGAAALVAEVRALEAADATARAFLGPSKTHDDATVAHLHL